MRALVVNVDSAERNEEYFVEALVDFGGRRGKEFVHITMFGLLDGAGVRPSYDAKPEQIRSLLGKEFEIGALTPYTYTSSNTAKLAEGPRRWTVRENPECDRCGKYCDCGDNFIPK